MIPQFGSPDRNDSLRPEGDVALATKGGRLDAPKRGPRGFISNQNAKRKAMALAGRPSLFFVPTGDNRVNDKKVNEENSNI